MWLFYLPCVNCKTNMRDQYLHIWIHAHSTQCMPVYNHLHGDLIALTFYSPSLAFQTPSTGCQPPGVFARPVPDEHRCINILRKRIWKTQDASRRKALSSLCYLHVKLATCSHRKGSPKTCWLPATLRKRDYVRIMCMSSKRTKTTTKCTICAFKALTLDTDRIPTW